MPALREQAARHAGKDVSGAGSGQSRVAGRVDDGFAVRRADNGAGAFQNGNGMVFFRQHACCLEPIRLDGFAVGSQKACSLKGMRCDDGWCSAFCHRLLQVGVIGQDVQCVGVENGRLVRFDDPSQVFARRC